MLHSFARRLNELHKQDRKGEKGFTLIELLAVVIISTLAAVVIPVLLGQRSRAVDVRAQAKGREARRSHATGPAVRVRELSSCSGGLWPFLAAPRRSRGR